MTDGTTTRTPRGGRGLSDPVQEEHTGAARAAAVDIKEDECNVTRKGCKIGSKGPKGQYTRAVEPPALTLEALGGLGEGPLLLPDACCPLLLPLPCAAPSLDPLGLEEIRQGLVVELQDFL